MHCAPYENWSHINPPMSKVDLESDQFEMIKSSRKPFNGNKEFRISLIWGFREGVYKNIKLHRFFNPFMKEHGLVVAMDRVLMLGSISGVKAKTTKTTDDVAKKIFMLIKLMRMSDFFQKLSVEDPCIPQMRKTRKEPKPMQRL